MIFEDLAGSRGWEHGPNNVFRATSIEPQTARSGGRRTSTAFLDRRLAFAMLWRPCQSQPRS